MDTITLRKDEDGRTTVVTLDQTERVVSLTPNELRRQIREHSAVIEVLQQQLQAVIVFESESLEEDTPVLQEVENPIVDKVILDVIAKEEPKDGDDDALETPLAVGKASA